MKAVPCIFCGHEGKLTGEHAFPDWLRREVGDGGAHYGRRTAEGQIDQWQTIAYSTKVNDVCQRCNNEWMSDIENSVKSLLMPMIRTALPVTLYPATLKAIATWSLLRSLVLSRVTTQDDLPQELFRQLERTHAANPRIGVWLGKLEGTDARTAFFTGASVNVAGTNPANPDGWFATMAIGKLVSRTFTLFGDAVTGPVAHGQYERFLTPIWPNRHIGHWPPTFFNSRPAFNVQTYRDFVRTIPTVWIAVTG